MKKVIVKINGTEILFSNLTLIQEMCALHSFNFNYQIESPNGVSIDTYIDFYDKYLNQTIEIIVDQKTIFEGLVSQIECINQYDFYIEFEIKGNCKMIQLDLVEECKCFNKTKPSDIFKALIKDVPSDIKPIHDEILHYTVQYNTTPFKMLQMLCTREGEWFYYDGKKTVIKKPENNAIKLNQKYNEIYNIKLDVKLPKGANSLLGYDTIKGNFIKETPKKQANKEKNLTAITQNKQYFAGEESVYNIQSVPFEDYLKRSKEKFEVQRTNETVLLKCNTNNSTIGLGSIIELINDDKSNGTYLIKKIIHRSLESTTYENEIEAIPNDVKYAYYVNPEAKIEVGTTYAIVSQNEDPDGLSRIKVKFYWFKNNEESCWMDLVSPHAGAGKGFRFIPDIGDEVMVSFYDNNIEVPYAIGAVYSNDRKDNVPFEGNYIKTIATKTNRRIEFDEKRGLLFLTDFYNDDKSGNSIFLEKNTSNQITHINTQKDESNKSLIQLDVNSGINISIIEDDKSIIHIELDSKSKKMEIFAKNEITIHSENTINVNATNINIEAENTLKIKSKKFELESDEIKIDAKMKAELKGGQKLNLSALLTEVKADTTLSLNGGAQAALKGGIVMIN